MLLPAGLRFRFALAASRWQGRLTAARGGNGALTEAMMHDHWLRELTLHGAFPVPWRLHGRDVLDRYTVPGPVLFYTTHLPLGEVPLRANIELGYPIPVPVADPGRILGRDQYVVTGMEQRIPALPAGPYVLARMRTLLRQGTSVVCLADNEFGGQISANPLRLAGRLRVPVIFVWAKLAADRIVDVTFQAAPHPLCEDEAAIAENVQSLRALNESELRLLGVRAASEVEEESPRARHARKRT